MIPAEIQQTRQRFGIIGNAPGLIRAITRALQIAPIDLAVLITGKAERDKSSFHRLYMPTVLESMENILP